MLIVNFVFDNKIIKIKLNAQIKEEAKKPNVRSKLRLIVGFIPNTHKLLLSNSQSNPHESMINIISPTILFNSQFH